MFLLWLSSAVLAGQVYINGVQVHPPQVAGTTLENVQVTFDEAGDVRIVAPGYQIEVLEPPPGQAATQSTTRPSPQPAGTFNPAAPGSYRPTPPAAKANAPSASPVVGAPPVGSAPPEPQSAVPRARWWLVTEDNGSKGHTVNVYINGQRVQTIQSGESTRITDIGPHLNPGSNHVRIQSDSRDPSGGAMYIYLGSGSDQSGTVVMDSPQVQYSLGAGRAGPYERSYTLTAE